eukprot:3406440-Pleurochrysis_carterae.AAC.1
MGRDAPRLRVHVRAGAGVGVGMNMAAGVREELRAFVRASARARACACARARPRLLLDLLEHLLAVEEEELAARLSRLEADEGAQPVGPLVRALVVHAHEEARA